MYECDIFCPLSACPAIGSEMRLADAKQPPEMHSLAPKLVPKKKRSRFRLFFVEISGIKVNHPRFPDDFLCKILFPKLNSKGIISYGIPMVILGQFFEISSTLKAPFSTIYNRIAIIFTNNNIYGSISSRTCWFYVDGWSTDRRYTVNHPHCWRVIWVEKYYNEFDSKIEGDFFRPRYLRD